MTSKRWGDAFSDFRTLRMLWLAVTSLYYNYRKKPSCMSDQVSDGAISSMNWSNLIRDFPLSEEQKFKVMDVELARMAIWHSSIGRLSTSNGFLIQTESLRQSGHFSTSLSFGAMIGWGWVVLLVMDSESWCLGAILAFFIGGSCSRWLGWLTSELTSRPMQK